MFSLTDLPPRWTARAAEMRFLGQEPQAALIEALLGEFEKELDPEALETVSITEISPMKRRLPEQLLTADDVADWLSIDRQRVYRQARDGKLPSIRLGDNTVRFLKTEIERWLKRRTG